VDRLKDLWDLLLRAAAAFGEDRAGRMATALAFTTLFSLVPLLFVASAVAGFVLGDRSALATVIAQAEQVVGAQVAAQLEDILLRVVDSAPASLGLGVGLAAVAGSAVFLQLQAALSDVFGVPQRRMEGVVGVLVQRLLAAVTALVFAVLVLLPLVAVAVLDRLAGLFGVPGWVAGLGVPLLALAYLAVVIALSFQWFTTAQIPWRAAFRGGVFTAVALLVASAGVGIYLSRVGREGPSALGVLGGVAILLFFFNLAWQVYLFGAEVTKALTGGAAPVEANEIEEEEPSGSPLLVVAAFLVGLLVGLRNNRR
jgi:membrane protein